MTILERLSPGPVSKEPVVARFFCRFVNVAGAQVAATELDAFNVPAAMAQARQLAAHCHVAGITAIELFLNGTRVDQPPRSPDSGQPRTEQAPIPVPRLSGAVALTPR